jgi:outer membrane receptor protein involved in Fe transport
VQLALRQDWTRSTLPGAATFVATDPPPYAKQNSTTLYTAGARVMPLPGVMLRASLATGALPPATSQLGTRQFNAAGGAQDPRRGGRLVGSETAALTRTGGNADLRPERARSISLGAVITPGGSDGPRISIDFTRSPSATRSSPSRSPP